MGMFPNCNDCLLGESIISRCANVFDTIYNPKKTKLLEIAEAHGAEISNGLSMLVWQAAAAQEIWIDVKYTQKDVESVMDLLLKSRGEKQ